MEFLLNMISTFSRKVSLPFYVFAGGLIEELIAPIPSPLIMTTAGSIAHEQERFLSYLLFLSMLSAVGKTIGSLILYYLTDKAEDVVLTKFGKLIGVTHKEIESVGSRFNNTWTDDLLLIFLRAIPIFPGTPITVVAGLIKLNLRTFIVSTFIGVTIRSLIFALIGYFGFSSLENGILEAEHLGLVALAVILLAAVFYFLSKKRGLIQKEILDRIKSK